MTTLNTLFVRAITVLGNGTIVALLTLTTFGALHQYL